MNTQCHERGTGEYNLVRGGAGAHRCLPDTVDPRGPKAK